MRAAIISGQNSWPTDTVAHEGAHGAVLYADKNHKLTDQQHETIAEGAVAKLHQNDSTDGKHAPTVRAANWAVRYATSPQTFDDYKQIGDVFKDAASRTLGLSNGQVVAGLAQYFDLSAATGGGYTYTQGLRDFVAAYTPYGQSPEAKLNELTNAYVASLNDTVRSIRLA